MKRLLFLLVLFGSAIALNAQFIIGYNAGYAFANELNREIYLYNEVNGSGLTKRMGDVDWYHGPAIGISSPTESRFVELLYSRKRTQVASEFDSAGVPMTRQIRVVCGTFNLAAGWKNEKWKIGISWDFGRYKGFGRRGQQSTIGDQEWTRLWMMDETRILLVASRLYIAETIFVERKFGFAAARFYFQLPGKPSDMEDLEWWLFGDEINSGLYPRSWFVNTGIMISFQFGG